MACLADFEFDSGAGWRTRKEKMAGDKKTKSSTLKEVVTRDYTIHLHKHLHGW